MTDCTTQPLLFSSLGSKKIQADFNGGSLTSATAQVTTIRLKLLKIGARITCSVRRIVLHLAGGYPYKELFAEVLSRLGSAFLPRLASG
jgi:hypothetical protein